MKIPTIEDHCKIYKDTTPFPRELDSLYVEIANLPWDEYFTVFKHTDYAPLDLIGKGLIQNNIKLDDRKRRWAGKCAKTIMVANGYQIAYLPTGKPRTKRCNNELFGRITCFVIKNK